MISTFVYSMKNLKKIEPVSSLWQDNEVSVPTAQQEILQHRNSGGVSSRDWPIIIYIAHFRYPHPKPLPYLQQNFIDIADMRFISPPPPQANVCLSWNLYMKVLLFKVIIFNTNISTFLFIWLKSSTRQKGSFVTQFSVLNPVQGNVNQVCCSIL